ncbi:MAG: CYTH domain-containing protein [Fermentimonas sp.]|jgi:adenylate cyclase
MAFEIERKFLVNSHAFKQDATRKTRIVQGYLSSVPERTVRVRVRGDKGFLTVKGIGSASGATRYEWEKEIPVAEAEELLAICEPGVIDKTRYEIERGRFIFEVDEFYGDNAGLVLAEIELPNEDAEFDRPEWLGREVTGDPSYYNSMLSVHPYSKWGRDK